MRRPDWDLVLAASGVAVLVVSIVGAVLLAPKKDEDMNKGVAASVVAVGCFLHPCDGEAAKLTPVEDAAVKYVVPVAFGDGFGHACPISEDEALTAHHVSGEDEPHPLMWSDGDGNIGTFAPQAWDRRRDVARLHSVDKFTKWFGIASVAPKPGDKVLIVGFDWKKGMAQRLVWAAVENMFAGVLVYDNTPGPGSSGSCVLNEAGEVVAINYASMQQSSSERPKGLGWLVAAGLDAFPQEWTEDQTKAKQKPAGPVHPDTELR